jgi:hypothetical protein
MIAEGQAFQQLIVLLGTHFQDDDGSKQRMQVPEASLDHVLVYTHLLETGMQNRASPFDV